MAILRRAEKQTQSKIDSVSRELEWYRSQNFKLEHELRAFKTWAEVNKKEKNKLACKVQDLESKLSIARLDAFTKENKLKSTEAQVDTMLAEKQRSSDERAALVQNVSELEVACQRFRRRAVQRRRSK